MLDFFCFLPLFPLNICNNHPSRAIATKYRWYHGQMGMLVNVNVGDGDREILLLDIDAEHHLMKGGTTGRWACWQPG